jgi:hypothetical protein
VRRFRETRGSSVQFSPLQGEYDATGNLIQETVWLDDTPVATLRKPANAITPGTITGSAVIYRIWSDHLDTPRTITAITANSASNSAANQAVRSWDSDAFGNTLATNPCRRASTETVDPRDKMLITICDVTSDGYADTLCAVMPWSAAAMISCGDITLGSSLFLISAS